MRILITKKGEMEVKVIDQIQNEKEKKKKKKRHKSNSAFNLTRSSIANKSEWNKNDTSFLSKTNSHFPIIKPSYVDINESKIANNLLNEATKITLKQPKILEGKQNKQLIKLYQESHTTPMTNSRNAKGVLVSNLHKSYTNDQNIKPAMRLKKILSEKAINSIKKEIITKEESIINHKKQSEDDFRTVYGQWNNKIDEFEHMLLKEIKADKNDLINYFSQKDDVSIVSFNHLCCSNNDQIIKMNKICQMIFENQAELVKEKERIREKLIRKKHDLRMASRKSVDSLSSKLSQTKRILDKYNQQYPPKSQYKILLEDIRRVYWAKNNANNLSRKSNINNKEIINDDTSIKK